MSDIILLQSTEMYINIVIIGENEIENDTF